ncbi:MAG TPA: hypothetical protein VK485_03430 [Sphingomicrobium sp.]|nr:hypothetical protein [Sphingomicrobium sp.]
MADKVPLSVLLPDRLDSMAERVKSKMCEDEQVGGMKLAWGFVGTEIFNALKSVLDCDLLEILAKGWAQASVLADFADSGRHPPGERSVVELGAHDVSRELHPVIAITVGSCPCVELKFTFTVTANIGGVRLSILDGHIIGGDLGEAWAAGQLSYEGMPLHSAANSKKIGLPGEFGFTSPGIAIPRIGLAA